MTVTPRATYRLQLRGGMTFEAAARIVPYLARLGASHLYLSPIFEAAPGSTHGYDVTDCNTLDAVLGGEAGFHALSEALRRSDLRTIVDFVPNHMAASPENGWWRDVLEWGEASRYAHHFDIDWSAPKLLLPVLGNAYGRVLAAGELRLAFDQNAGQFSIVYGDDLRLPLWPPSYAEILSRIVGDGWTDLAREFAGSTPDNASALKRTLSACAGERRELLNDACASVNADPAQLHNLLERQVWRLAHWRLGREQLSYRRFFEITGLVGLKVERSDVFDDVHRKLFALVRAGEIDGIRLDHIDGLADPRRYLQMLRDDLGNDTYIVAEKILGVSEQLRPEWPIAGTTGYEVANLLTELLVDAGGERELTCAYHDFIRGDVDYEALAQDAKRQILGSNLAAELARLVAFARDLASADVATRDIGADTLRTAIMELATAMPIYRTYVDESGSDAIDRTVITKAIAQAKTTRRIDNADALDFLARALLLDLPSGPLRQKALALTQLFQQTTGPVMAKAIEDTVFYRYNRLIALNEVGGEPTHFGLSIHAFHDAMKARHYHQPHGLSTTSTHDTKRGEDARARVCVLSEVPEIWSQGVQRWRQLNLELTAQSGTGSYPDAETEWLFYQALLGAWPMQLCLADGNALALLANRMSAFMTKAVREAKVSTSWANENQTYEAVVERLVRGALDLDRSRASLEDFAATVAPIVVTGALNSLSQTLIKIAGPGVPDIYQGTEVWDLSLVDPDNRRPVDFAMLSSLLDKAEAAAPEALLQDWRCGLPKLRVVARGLALRRLQPDLFAAGDYVPLDIEGSLARHAVAFARVHSRGAAIVVVPRLMHHLIAGSSIPHVPAEAWLDTAVRLRGELVQFSWRNVLEDERDAFASLNGQIRLGTALARFPVALLISDLS